MNQQTSEQEWHRLQHRIQGFIDHLLKEDIPAIEHKSNVMALLPAPSEYLNRLDLEMQNDL